MKRPQMSVAKADFRRWNQLREQVNGGEGCKGFMAPLASSETAQRAKAEGKTWFKISNSVEGATSIYVYDEIGWYGVTASDFILALKDVTTDAIDLRLNSPGGDVYDGIAIYSALVDHPASVTVTVDALAASAASFIAQAGDHVVMGRNSEMMIHDAWGACMGNAEDMHDMAGLLDKASDNIASIYAARAGNGGTATWRKAMKAESWYNADEAVKAGLADEVAKTTRRRGADNKIAATLTTDDAPPVEDKVATEPPDTDPPVTTEDEQVEDDFDFDSIEYDPKALHLAMLDAADLAGLGVNTTPLRESLEEFKYNPEVFVASLLDALDHPAEPTDRDLDQPAPRHIPIDLFTDAVREALQP